MKSTSSTPPKGHNERRSRDPWASPHRLEDPKFSRAQAPEQRRHPRQSQRLSARIFRPSRKTGTVFDFAAKLDTNDVSVGGAFLQSTFFLKSGSRFHLEFELPKSERMVQVEAQVVRNFTDPGNGNATGFGVHFIKFMGESEIFLRAYLAKGDIYRFVENFQKKNAPLDSERLVEMLVRWEIYQEQD